MKKFIVSLATISMAALLFTACNSGEKAPATPAVTTPAATTTVTPDVKAPAVTPVVTPATPVAPVKAPATK